MEANDKAAIDGLFERLDQAERASGPRDAQAEAYIRDRMARQPAAPYYLAQAVLVQQQGLEALNARIEELERDLAQRPAAGGGFLGSLFGAPRGDQRRLSYPQQPNPQMQAFRTAPQGSFLGGAMQTAMGVAGGLLLGNAIASMFTGGEADAAEPEPQAADESDDGGFDFGGEEW